MVTSILQMQAFNIFMHLRHLELQRAELPPKSATTDGDEARQAKSRHVGYFDAAFAPNYKLSFYCTALHLHNITLYCSKYGPMCSDPLVLTMRLHFDLMVLQ